MGGFPVAACSHLHGNGHVQQPVGTGLLSQIGDQVGLHFLKLGRGVMTDQDRPVAPANQVLERTRQRIESAGKQQDLVRLEAAVIGKPEIAFAGTRHRTRDEGKRVLVLRQHPQRLFEEASDLRSVPQIRDPDRNLEAQPAAPVGTELTIGRPAAPDGRIGRVDIGRDLEQVDNMVGEIRHEPLREPVDTQRDGVVPPVHIERQSTARRPFVRTGTAANEAFSRHPGGARAHRGSS